MQHSFLMVDPSKKIQDLTGDELKELKEESDRVFSVVQEFQNKINKLVMNPGSVLRFPKDFKGRDGATYRWKEITHLFTTTEKVNDAVVE